jgi:hypothetical protein
MAHEDGVLEGQLVPDFDYVIRITGQRRIFAGVVSREVGAAGADMVEQHNSEVLLELRRYEPPHVLIAAETMGEDHGPFAGTVKVHFVPFDYAHKGLHYRSSY